MSPSHRNVFTFLIPFILLRKKNQNENNVPIFTFRVASKTKNLSTDGDTSCNDVYLRSYLPAEGRPRTEFYTTQYLYIVYYVILTSTCFLIGSDRIRMCYYLLCVFHARGSRCRDVNSTPTVGVVYRNISDYSHNRVRLAFHTGKSF